MSCAWKVAALVVLSAACARADDPPEVVFETLEWTQPGSCDGFNIYMGEQSAAAADGSVDLRKYAGRLRVESPQGMNRDCTAAIIINHPVIYYAVTAFNGAGESAPSNEANTLTGPFDTTHLIRVNEYGVELPKETK